MLVPYNGQPFVEAQFATPTISSNLPSGGNGGWFGSGVFGPNNNGSNYGGTTNGDTGGNG